MDAESNDVVYLLSSSRSSVWGTSEYMRVDVYMPASDVGAPTTSILFSCMPTSSSTVVILDVIVIRKVEMNIVATYVRGIS